MQNACRIKLYKIIQKLIESWLAAGESINTEEDQWLYEAKTK